MPTSQKILTAFLWCSIASSVLLVWNEKYTFIKTIISISLEILAIFKIFGLALLVITGIGIGIAIWEHVIDKSKIWNQTKSTENLHHSSSSDKHATHSSPSRDLTEGGKEQDRSVASIIVVLVVLALIALTDASIYFSSTQQTSPPKPVPQRGKSSHLNRTFETFIHTSAIQFSSAILTLGLVIAFILFNKDEYHVWKARQKLKRDDRRRARAAFT